jgi:hypothetical protein
MLLYWGYIDAIFVLITSFSTGMNFYDFFVFITCFCLANLVQLCYLLRDCKSIQSSSLVAQHLALNLGSVRKIVDKLKSVGGLAGNHGFFLDMRETLDDPRFFHLCTGLERVYGMIHKQQSCCFDTKKDLVDDLRELDTTRTYGSQVFTAEDLISFIDNAITKLSCTNCEGIVLPSEWDGA